LSAVRRFTRCNRHRARSRSARTQERAARSPAPRLQRRIAGLVEHPNLDTFPAQIQSSVQHGPGPPWCWFR
jgi:hypothetical protein